MKRTITTIMAILMLATSIMAILMLATSCFALSRWNKKFAEFEDEYFKYWYWSKNEIGISGLTEIGAQQQVLVIPPKVKGKPVVKIGQNLPFSWAVEDIEISKLKKLFIPSTIYSIEGLIQCTGERYFIFNKMEQVRSNTQLVHNLRGGICVITKELFDEFSKTWKYPESVSEQYIIASIEFLLNFKTDETDVFWLDIEPAESLITKWYEGYYVPEREGYTFIGWYKEPECINEWNFESDKTPAEVLDETTCEPITLITRLYAKWEQN